MHLENDNNLESKKIDMTSVKLIKNNLVIIIFLLYVSPNTSISYIQNFLLNKLEKFKKKEEFEKTPIIVCGDFNINLLSYKNYNLVEFLKKNWNIDFMNDKDKSTTKQNTCIDLIFSRYLNIELKNYISYFSYHNPICIVIK